MSVPRVVNTYHTGLTVSDLMRTVGYFHEVLGFEVVSVAPRDAELVRAVTGIEGASVMVAYVRGAGHTVELVEYSGPPDRRVMRPRPCDTGFAHLAYDVEGLDQLTKALAIHGVLPLAPPITVTGGPNAGKKSVYLRDWDGITIELMGFA